MKKRTQRADYDRAAIRAVRATGLDVREVFGSRTDEQTNIELYRRTELLHEDGIPTLAVRTRFMSVGIRLTSAEVEELREALGVPIELWPLELDPVLEEDVPYTADNLPVVGEHVHVYGYLLDYEVRVVDPETEKVLARPLDKSLQLYGHVWVPLSQIAPLEVQEASDAV